MNGINKVTLVTVSLILITPWLSCVKANPTKIKIAAQDQNPILFLHGGFKDKEDWVTMMGWFKADGWPDTTLYAYTFAENDDCTFEVNINNTNQIKQWVDEILNETGADKIDIVAHSMGGMSSRYYIKFLGGIDTIDDYVSLGSPHHGNNWSSCGREGVKEMALILNEGDETPGGILNDTLGIRYDPIWNITYNSSHIPGTINYTSIYSRDDGICQYISSPLDGAYNIEVEKIGHSQLFKDESVYELVKVAVDFLPNGTPMTTPSWSVLHLLLSLFVIHLFRDKKKKS
jgi:triacylglycerol lipase